MTLLLGKRVLVTGGAGFIGSRLCRRLSDNGAQVTAFDNLLEQVHGPTPTVDPELNLVRGDIRDRDALASVVQRSRPDVVVHLAAETGTGQSADEPIRYSEVNVVGTAILLETLKGLPKPPTRIVLAATRAVYGEGAYADTTGGLFIPPPRDAVRMAAGEFDIVDRSGVPLKAFATPESLPPRPGSVYGSTKLMQEFLLQQTPASWDHVILRMQNVYGPGQSLRNPYTGVLSIFCQQAMSGKTLGIYEDGEIHRDFVFVDDVVDAFARACTASKATNAVINIGSGRRTSIREAAERILVELGEKPDVEVTAAFRPGDIRHAVANVEIASSLLNWKPETEFETGVAKLVEWARNNKPN